MPLCLIMSKSASNSINMVKFSVWQIDTSKCAFVRIGITQIRTFAHQNCIAWTCILLHNFVVRELFCVHLFFCNVFLSFIVSSSVLSHCTTTVLMISYACNGLLFWNNWSHPNVSCLQEEICLNCKSVLNIREIIGSSLFYLSCMGNYLLVFL